MRTELTNDRVAALVDDDDTNPDRLVEVSTNDVAGLTARITRGTSATRMPVICMIVKRINDNTLLID